MRTRSIWTLVLAALLFLSYGGNVNAAVIEGCHPNECTHSVHSAKLDACHGSDCDDSQSHDTSGRCHCPCHLSPLADLVSMKTQIAPALRPLPLLKATNEAVQEGPATGIDLPPQLA